MTTTQKVFISCALGAFIGALVALELQSYLWWVGVFVGAFAGYISYEFRTVLKAINIAWKRTMAVEFTLQKVLTGLSFLLALFCLLLTAALPFIFISERTEALLTAGVMGIMSCFFAGIAYVCARDDSVSLPWRWVAVALFASPLGYLCVVLIIATVIVSALWEDYGHNITRLPAGGRNFGKELFFLIHSEMRLMCALDAAIGAGVGYWAGSALVGAFAGGILGVLNYQIVSVWILGLSPENSGP